jgi:NADPH2:quinone reductase
MKAAQIKKFDGNELLINRTHKPQHPGQLLVSLCSWVAIDWKIREGYVPLQFPATLGGFLSVIAGMEGISKHKKGDEVCRCANILGGSGSFANLFLQMLWPINQEHHSLKLVHCHLQEPAPGRHDHMGLTRNQKILIHGGAGSIGSIAIQLAGTWEHMWQQR